MPLFHLLGILIIFPYPVSGSTSEEDFQNSAVRVLQRTAGDLDDTLEFFLNLVDKYPVSAYV